MRGAAASWPYACAASPAQIGSRGHEDSTRSAGRSLSSEREGAVKRFGSSRTRILMGVFAAFAAGLSGVPTAAAQDPNAARLEAINLATQQGIIAAQRAAATAGPTPRASDGRPAPSLRGYVGAVPPNYPEGVATPARPKGPGGRSVSSGKGP